MTNDVKNVRMNHNKALRRATITNIAYQYSTLQTETKKISQSIISSRIVYQQQFPFTFLSQTRFSLVATVTSNSNLIGLKISSIDLQRCRSGNMSGR
jgi:hypothetical protein